MNENTKDTKGRKAPKVAPVKPIKMTNRMNIDRIYVIIDRAIMDRQSSLRFIARGRKSYDLMKAIASAIAMNKPVTVTDSEVSYTTEKLQDGATKVVIVYEVCISISYEADTLLINGIEASAGETDDEALLKAVEELEKLAGTE